MPISGCRARIWRLSTSSFQASTVPRNNGHHPSSLSLLDTAVLKVKISTHLQSLTAATTTSYDALVDFSPASQINAPHSTPIFSPQLQANNNWRNFQDRSACSVSNVGGACIIIHQPEWVRYALTRPIPCCKSHPPAARIRRTALADPVAIRAAFCPYARAKRNIFVPRRGEDILSYSARVGGDQARAIQRQGRVLCASQHEGSTTTTCTASVPASRVSHSDQLLPHREQHSSRRCCLAHRRTKEAAGYE